MYGGFLSLSMFIRSPKAFTMVEILVAAVIFVTTVTGIFAMLSAFSQSESTTDYEDKLGAAYFAKQVLDDLRSRVSYDSWESGALVVGDCQDYVDTNPTYCAKYDVKAIPGSSARDIVVYVDWGTPCTPNCS